MNRKLREIGESTDLSDDDIKGIEKEKLKERIVFILIGMVITFCIIVLGYNVLDLHIRDGGYPYAVSIPLLAKKSSSSKLNPIIATILMILVTATLASVLYMPMYGVYSDKERKNINESNYFKKMLR